MIRGYISVLLLVAMFLSGSSLLRRITKTSAPEHVLRMQKTITPSANEPMKEQGSSSAMKRSSQTATSSYPYSHNAYPNVGAADTSGGEVQMRTMTDHQARALARSADFRFWG
jgi:hypothetical protein